MKKFRALIFSICAFALCLTLTGCFFNKNDDNKDKENKPTPVAITAEDFYSHLTNDNTTSAYAKYKIEINDQIQAFIEIDETTQGKILIDLEDKDYEIYLFNNKCFVSQTNEDDETDTFVFNYNFNDVSDEYSEQRVIDVVELLQPLYSYRSAYSVMAKELNLSMPAPNAVNKYYKTVDNSKITYDIDLDYTITQNDEIVRCITDMEATYVNNKLTTFECEKVITESSGNNVITTNLELEYEPYTQNITIPSLTNYEQAN